MDGFDTFLLYSAIHNHFTSPSYDFFKYQGKTRVKFETYNKRKDKYQFDRLGKLIDPRLRLVASNVEGIKWIGDIVGPAGAEAQVKHQKYLDSASHYFKQELNTLDPDGNNYRGANPLLAQLYFRKKLSLETLCLINNLVDFTSLWKDSCSTDPLIGQLIVKIEKYSKFISYDSRKIQQIFHEFCISK